MSHSLRTFARRSFAALASAALLTGAVAAPAQAQPEYTAQASSTESALEQLQLAFLMIVAVPVMGSSFLSSIIGIPQCGLHDTRAC